MISLTKFKNVYNILNQSKSLFIRSNQSLLLNYSQLNKINTGITTNSHTLLHTNNNNNNNILLINNQYQKRFIYNSSNSFQYRYGNFSRLKSCNDTEIYSHFNSNCIDSITGEISYVDIITFLRAEDFNDDIRLVNLLFSWCTVVMKCKDLNILTQFLNYYRKVKSKQFLHVLNYINQNNIPQNIWAFNVTLYFYTENHMLSEAKELAKLMLSMHTTIPPKVYIAMLKSLRHDNALMTSIMEKIAQEPEDSPTHTNDMICNLVIQIYLETHMNFNEAYKHFTETEKKGVEIHRATIISFLEYHSRNSTPATTFQFFRYCLENHPKITLSHECLVSCVGILSNFQQEYMALVDYICETVTDTRAFFNLSISTFSRNKKREMVIHLYNRMIRYYTPDAVTFKTLIYLSIHSNNLEECLYWLECMKKLDIEPSIKIYSYILRYFLRFKHYDLFDQYIAEAKQLRYFNPWIISSAICSAVTRNQTKELDQLLRECLRKDSSDAEFVSTTTDLVCQTFLMMDNYAKAQEWFELKQKKWDLNPTLFSYQIFMSYHTVRHEYQQWSYWSNRMKSAGIQNDIEVQNRVLLHFRKFYRGLPETEILLDDNSQLYPMENGQFYQVSDKLDVDDMDRVIGEYRQSNPQLKNAASSLFRNRIITLTHEGSIQQAIDEMILNEQKNFPMDANTYFHMINTCLHKKNWMHTKLFFVKALEKGFLPNQAITTQVIDLAFVQGKKVFNDFLENSLPNHLLPKDFEESTYSVLLRWDIKRALKDLMEKPSLLYLCKSPLILNNFVYSLSRYHQLERAEKIIQHMIDSKMQIHYLSLEMFYKMIVENGYHSAVLNSLLTYHQQQNIDHPTTFKAALISNLYLENRIEEAYHQYQRDILSNTQKITQYQIDIGIKIYAKQFPIPPISNLQVWLSLKEHLPFKVRDKSILTQVFKCLIEVGREDRIARFLDIKDFVKNASPELLITSLKSLSSPKDIIKICRDLIAKKSHCLPRKEFYDIFTKANETVNDPIVSKYLATTRPVPQVPDQIFKPKDLEFIDKNIINHFIY
ncbi:hybrid histidine kinase DHKB [Tieghemostelium lacteum]|uniref:Hybrid histidine kinase DHKB n=1 Tax=Tieghemostelium lacteum TaxID=361077 RepID=A0A151ZCR9_TIELA|nr:hybrid histidine kinase DHKB [Tieghemostelium lacteum]|eukprot:KYQ91748.1 hybrid histidine kinase DHKB [Tieghemostelium lacteum]